jgi:hypothetical protein
LALQLSGLAIRPRRHATRLRLAAPQFPHDAGRPRHAAIRPRIIAVKPRLTAFGLRPGAVRCNCHTISNLYHLFRKIGLEGSHGRRKTVMASQKPCHNQQPKEDTWPMKHAD